MVAASFVGWRQLDVKQVYEKIVFAEEAGHTHHSATTFTIIA